MAKEKKVDDFALYEALCSFESPCNWSFPEIIFGDKIAVCKSQQLEEKIRFLEAKEKENPKEGAFKWRMYVNSAALSFYSFKRENMKQAWEAIEKSQATLDDKNIKDSFFESIKSSLYHVLLAMKGRFYFEEEDYVNAQKLADKIKTQKSMNNIEKAGLLGIKASIFNEFGTECSNAILDDIRQAVELNPDEAEWTFMLGKTLRRVRKMEAFFDIPQQEELLCFEKAYNKKKCSGFSLFCALSYKEFAWKLFQKFNKTPNMEKLEPKIKGLNEKAHDLFMEALSYGDLTAQALAKVSRGLSDLPYPFKQVGKAKELALKAVEMNPTNPMTLHTLAMFYERHELDYEKALEFNEKALEHGSYGSGMDIIKINLKINPDYDPLPILTELKEKYLGDAHQYETALQEGFYYLIAKQDLDQALDILMNIINKCPDLHGLNVCKPIWLQLRVPISTYELLYHELKSSRNAKKTAYLDALIKIKLLKPELFEKDVDPNFLNDLKEESRKNMAHYASRKPTSTRNWNNSRPADGANDRGYGRPPRYNNQWNQNEGSWRSPNTRNTEHNSSDSRNPGNNRGRGNTRGGSRQMTRENRGKDFSNLRQKGQRPNEDKARDSSETIRSAEKHAPPKPKENKKTSPARSHPQDNPSMQKESVTEGKNISEQQNEKKPKEDTADINTSLPNETDVISSTVKKQSKADEPEDSCEDSYDENENQSDEEEYRRKIKFNKEKILEKIRQQKARLRNQSLTVQNETNSASISCKTQKYVEKRSIACEVQESVEKRKDSLSQSQSIAQENDSNTGEPSHSLDDIKSDNILQKSDSLPKVVDEFSTQSSTSIPECDSKALPDSKVNITEDITNQLSQLDIEEKKSIPETTGSNCDTKMNKKESRETENDDSATLAEQIKQLSKEQMEILLKMMAKEEGESKKKKTRKTAVKSNTPVDVKDEEESSALPPKMAIETANNQAIRQPKGPSGDSFSMKRK
ncbi:hypothetical protein M8J76_002030 [Diaphorina citri]|nr:hypothetical protein M8J75_001046 [Diaphorina citri]KAI5729395.1 hypothetical protein M8J76_002030 [Diaphorina citri]